MALYVQTGTQFLLYVAQLFLKREMFQQNSYWQWKHMLYTHYLFLENRDVWAIMWANMVEPDTS